VSSTAQPGRGVASRIRAHARLVGLLGAIGVILAIGVSIALAATAVVDLTASGSSATINGAVYTQGQAIPVSGTGVIDPFLRVQDSNSAIEKGISTDTDGVLQETDTWTKALRLSNVPVIKVGNTNYREFVLDINQVKADPLLSLDEVKIFLTSTPNIDTYTDGGLTGGGTLNSVAYPAYGGSGSRIGTMVFSQGDNVVKLDYTNESGSGKPDLTVLIPDSVFGTPGDASYCGYAQAGCNTWMGFYTQFGGWNGTNISGNPSLWDNNDGFEEWATIKRPVVNAVKTATATSGTNCTWGIDKSVDKTRVDIADGGTATFNYTVSVTHQCTTGVQPVTGTITVTNPETLPDGEPTVDATVSSISDIFTPGSVAGTVTCPGGIPFTLAGNTKNGSTKVCTYSLTLASPTNGTNTATITLSDTSVAPIIATAPVNFVNTNTDTSVTVVDDKTDPAHPVTLGTVTSADPSPKTFTYSLTKSGVAGTCTDYNNTATFTTNTTGTTGSDSQKVTVCVGKDLTVAKTATPTFTRKFTWGIDKLVDQTRIDIAQGGTATFNYTVRVTHDAGVDSAWATSGTITVSNPNDWEDITLTSLTDAVNNGGTCSITEAAPYTVTKSGSITLHYTCSWASAPSNVNGTNTATANWNATTYHTPTGSANGTATFNFSTPTTLTDETITVVDDKTDPANPVTLGTATYTDASPKDFTYSLTKAGVAGTCTDYNNTATFTTNDTKTTGSDSQKVTVCVGKDLTVTKTATPTFTRTYHWDITKDVDKTKVTIAQGGTATFNYTVSVTHDAGVDSAWATSGTITVSNPNDWEDISLTSLTDSVDNGGTCSITEAGPFSVAKSDSLTVHYTCTWASAPSKADGTNTATATWNASTFHTPTGTASGTKGFTFATPTTLVDESITVVDDKTDPANPVTLGTATYTDASPKSFTYSLTKAGVAGTCTDYTNTASFTTNDTGATDSAQQTVTVCVGKDLTVSKIVTTSFTRTYTWDIKKDVDKTKVTIADGGSATFHYTVTVSHDAGADTDWAATGTITVTNPNDFEDITADVTDAVNTGGTCSVTGGSGATIPAGKSVDFAYTCTWSSTPSNLKGTNTATAKWDKAAAKTPNDTATGTKDFEFTSATKVVDECINVTDTYAGTLGTVCVGDANPSTFTYDRTESGVAGTCTDYNNTATFVTNDTGATKDASQTVTVCKAVDLNVSKIVTTSFTRTYSWNIDKSVDKTKVTIADGASATFNYTVEVTHDAGKDTDWAAKGTITVKNPNDFEDIVADITDAVDNGGTCTVTGGSGATIPAGKSVDFDYTCTWSSTPSSLSGTNTATAKWDKAAAHTPDDTATGTKGFEFTAATTVIDECSTVVDDKTDPANPVTLGTACVDTDPSPKDFTYSLTKSGVAGTCTDYNNTATFTTNDTKTTGSDNQKVTVCKALDLTVSKTATPTFTTKYKWQITKDVDKTSVTINNGDSATFTYTVSVSHDAGTDSNWATTGTITVANPNDFEDIVVDLTDAVNNGGTCSVTNGTSVTVAAGKSVSRDYTCTWSSAPSSSSGTNTATASWDKAAAHTPSGSATGTKGFAFTTATTVTDECVNVTDTVGGTLGTACVGQANPKTFTYTRTVTPADYGNTCTTTTFDNTAKFTTNDTGATGSASKTVTVVTILCGVPGKTKGFWGNKNGHALIDKNNDGKIDTPVTIGAGTHTFTVNTIAQSDKILSNNDCTSGSPAIFTCTGSGGLRAGINVNSFEVLGAQTLALTYNIGKIDKFSGQTLAALGVQPFITPTLQALGVTSSTTVNELLVISNNLIDKSFKPGGNATQTQIGDMNSLLGMVNREAL
jgi:Fe-S cluster assembly iron-binding protein IscA